MSKTPNSDIYSIRNGEVVKPSTTATIYNVTCTDKDAEYNQALPSNCKSFVVGIQSKSDTTTWKLSFSTSGTSFFFNGSESYSQDNLLLSSQTLYFQSTVAGEIIQIIAYS